MDCPVCRHGTTRPGSATVTLERDDVTLVVRHVPAEVCDNCGEEYVAADKATKLLALLDAAQREGVHMDVRDYIAA